MPLPQRLPFTINGSNFGNPVTVQAYWTGDSGQIPSQYVTTVSSTRIDVTIAVDVTPDTWTLKVTNPNGQQSNGRTFTVTAPSSTPTPSPSPVISSITPSSVVGVPLPQRLPFTINGSNFDDSVTVQASWSTGSNPVPSQYVTRVSSTRIDVTIATDVTPDTWTLRVTNPDGQQSNGGNFTVTASSPSPVINNVTPPLVVGVPLPQRLPFTINGSNFGNSVTVRASWSTGSNPVPGQYVTRVSSTRIDVTIATDVTPDTWTLRVTNPDGQQSNGGHFTVTSPAFDAIRGDAPNGAGETTPVVIQLFGENNGALIDPDRRTWIVIHGRLNSAATAEIVALALAIKNQRVNDQVLTLDWSVAAQETAPYGITSAGERWILPVGVWAAGELYDHGFPSGNLNFVGHSWGSYVANEIANEIHNISGEYANSIVALDPAANTWGTSYDPNERVHFSSPCLRSWAFHSSDAFGSNVTPETANEAFSVHIGSPFADLNHGLIRNVFVTMLNSPTGGVSKYFSLQRLVEPDPTQRPWLQNQLDDDGNLGGNYEAYISIQSDLVSPEAISYVSSTTFDSTVEFETPHLAPEIAVSFAGVTIVDGDPSPSSSDGTNFGSVQQGAQGIEHTFTVRNVGTASLMLSLSSLPPGYTLIEGLVPTLQAGEGDTFTVRLDTNFAGIMLGHINIANNDSDENPFTFSVRGIVTGSPPVFRTLNLDSTNPNSGVHLSVSPNDNTGMSDGNTPLARVYDDSSTVMLLAEEVVEGNTFIKWQRDGIDYSTNPYVDTVLMDTDHTMTAVYVPSSPTPTPAQTATATPNQSSSPVSTPTPTPTATVTTTSSPTVTATATVTATPTIAPTPASTPSPTTTPSPAVALHHYTFYGPGVIDAVGNADGALGNGATVSSGKLNLDGIDDYVLFDQQIVPTDGAFSIAFFAQEVSSATSFAEIISQGVTGGPGFYVGYDPSHNIRIGDSLSNTGIPFPSDALTHHYAVTAGDDTRLYIDGSLVGTFARISISPDGDDTRLGRQYGGFDEFFHGNLADLWVFSGTLTADEVASLVTAPKTISGTISYCTNPVAGLVQGAVLTLTGTLSGTVLSDSSGNYQFASLATGGNYTVTPSKETRTPGSAGISIVDVIAVQRHSLNFGTPLSGCKLMAADVNDDAAINIVDVIAIQRFSLGLTTGIANVGQYKFIPASRSYPGLVSDQTGQNYDALVFGDVASPFVE